MTRHCVAESEGRGADIRGRGHGGYDCHVARGTLHNFVDIINLYAAHACERYSQVGGHLDRKSVG